MGRWNNASFDWPRGWRFLGFSGGVFANVRLNQRLAEEMPVDEVFVYLAMSDQGLACGGVLDFLLRRDGMKHWLGQRYWLDTLYCGRDYAANIDEHLGRDAGFCRISTAPVATVAELLTQARIVAIYTKGMEYGARAWRPFDSRGTPGCENQSDPERSPIAQRVHALCPGGDGRRCR